MTISSSTEDGTGERVRAPAAKRIPHTLTLHGDTRVDEFFWLRERDSPDVLAHLAAENAYTNAMTAPTLPLQAQIYAETLGHIQQTDLSAPYLRHGYFYYTRTQDGQQYAMHCRRRGSMTAPEEVLLDLNVLAIGKGFLSLGAFEVSDDGTRLAFSIDETGYRQYTLFVKNLVTGALEGEPVRRVDSVAWARDHRTLIVVTEDEVTKRADTVRRLELGTADLALVFHEDDESFDVAVERTRDGAYIMLCSNAKDTSEVRSIPADRPAAAPRLFAARRDGVRYDLDQRAGVLYIRTNEDAPDFRVFTTPVDRPERAAWTELIPQRPGITITGVELFADFIAIAGRRNGLASIELLRDASPVLEPLDFDEPDYVVRIGHNAEYATADLRYVYESPVTPPSVFDLEVATGARRLVKRTDVPNYEPDLYETQRYFATMTDGTRVPVSIVRRRDYIHAGAAPMLLYGYGSYGISMDATFSAARLSLLDRGVTFATAHVRGGGEYGEAWRLAAHLSRKRTTFTDFIDCAANLIAAGYTAADRLVIQGGSAGGLLVATAMNLRPDLFRAAIVAVPFVDVLTTMLDASLPLTTGEYREWGNPQDEAAYAYMRTYSPLDNIVAQPYPAVLVEISYNDSQVPYWEGAKYAAKLRLYSTSSRPILVKANMGAGHGGSSGRYDALKERAFEYAFVLNEVGITA